MPTGITCDIGKGMTFEQYVWRCARQFGALIDMRDEPTDAPIPDKIKGSDYYTNVLKEDQEELLRIRRMSFNQMALEAESWYDQEIKYVAESTQKKDKLREVDAFVSPSPDHDEHKEFMRKQILESIDWDCSMKYDKERFSNLVKPTGSEWAKTKIDTLEKSIKRHTKEAIKEISRTDERNEWITVLKKALNNRR